MYCQKCQTQNEESAQFCRNCGANLRYTQEQKQENDVSSTLLVVFIIIAFICQLANFAITKFVYDWYFGGTKFVVGCIWLIQGISFILPALSIKNKSLKIIGIIFASLMIIYSLYSNISFLIR